MSSATVEVDVQQPQKQHAKTKEQQDARCGTVATRNSVPAHGAAHRDQRAPCIHRRPGAATGVNRCSLQWASHIGVSLARGPCQRVRLHERASHCAASAAAMQPVRGGQCGQWIKLPSTDFLLAAGGSATARPTAAVAAKAAGTTKALTAAVAVTVESQQPQQPQQAQSQQWPAPQNYMQLVCRDKRGGASQPLQQQQQQQQQQQRLKASSTRLADVVSAGTFYAATSYWQQPQQPEDAYVVYRTADQRVYQQVGPYAPWRDMRPKVGCMPVRQITCADGDGNHDPSDHQDGGYTHHDQLQPFFAYQQQEHHPLQNWDQESYLPYQEGVPGINGQGDGDAPAYGGGALSAAGASDADVLREEQDEVVALLTEIDERHEKHLAFERVLQEREPNFWKRRWRAQAQLPSQQFLLPQQVVGASGPPDSVEVFVDGGVWRSASDHGLYRGRSDRRSCPPLRLIRQTSSVFFTRFIADDITITTKRTVPPLEPPPKASTPVRDNVVAVAKGAAQEKNNVEGASTAANVSAPNEDGKRNDVEPKCGDEASGSKDGKKSPSVDHRHMQVQAKEAGWTMPVTRNQQQPSHVQRQEPSDSIHQQRKPQDDYRRSAYPRREYHSTQHSNNRPPVNNHHHHNSDSSGAYSKGQQQTGRGGCQSANRNRNRPNHNGNRQCNGTNQWNKDRARQDAGRDVGNRGGFAGNRSSLPYCCRSACGGGSRVASPADGLAAATPAPPPSHRGRRYNSNNKQVAGRGGCGHPQAQRQYPAARPASQQVPPPPRDMQCGGGRSAATFDNSNGGRPQPNRKNNAESSRKPRKHQQQQQQRQQQRADNRQLCASSGAAEPTPSTSPARVSRTSCENAPPVCDSGDAATADCADGNLSDDAANRRAATLRLLWERTNLTIFRRRSSQ
ncbi:hypothetical protein HPB50_000942 [Hyalomma asiaticum]|uniref:Uncharacterized protein n=1 Tax=Hyalomma asiaticum TaxID=266040 RepID=A0ACB7SI00_HYAAI|nr:hypothetical protein HPB50_000942 [Hyalomma asiaticum]